MTSQSGEVDSLSPKSWVVQMCPPCVHAITLFDMCRTRILLYSAEMGGWGCNMELLFGTSVLFQYTGTVGRSHFFARVELEMHCVAMVCTSTNGLSGCGCKWIWVFGVFCVLAWCPPGTCRLFVWTHPVLSDWGGVPVHSQSTRNCSGQWREDFWEKVIQF